MNHNRYKFVIAKIILAIGLLCGNQDKSLAQQVDSDAFLSETVKRSPDKDRMTVFWWIPEEYWHASLRDDITVSPDKIEEFMKPLRPYMLFAVADGKIETFDTITYKSEAEIRKSIRLIDSNNNSYLPLGNDEIGGETQSLLLGLMPVLSKMMLGPGGQNLHFVLFPTKDKSGKQIVLTTTEGRFSLMYAGKEYKWKLPLWSLMPNKICPVDGEELSAGWKFCPWHGEKLVGKPSK
jgi:hypothetical protein